MFRGLIPGNDVAQRLAYLEQSSAQDNLHHVKVPQKQANVVAQCLVLSSVAVPELQVTQNTHKQKVKSPHFEKDRQRHLFSKQKNSYSSSAVDKNISFY